MSLEIITQQSETSEQFASLLHQRMDWLNDNLGDEQWWQNMSDSWQVMAELYQFLYHDLKHKGDTNV
jgi:hypothetical protein